MANPEENGAIPPKVSPITPVQPGAPRPITVRLKPVAKPAEPVATPAEAAPASPRQTSRIPLPDAAAHATASPISPISPVPPVTPAAGGATVRLRTVMVPKLHPIAGAAHVAQSPVQPATPVAAPAAAAAAPLRPSPLQPQPPPAPGSNPLPAGPKPPSAAQIQAAKSKTSRISLDSAIGVAPVGEENTKTIRLKRPADLAPAVPKPVISAPSPAAPAFKETTQIHQAAPLHQTSRIPDSEIPGVKPEPTVTQKKTLKIKRPGASSETPLSEASSAGTGDAEFANLKPLDMIQGEEQKSSSVFMTISVIVGTIAAVVLVLLTLCLGAQAMGPDAGKNSLASIPGPELPWGSK